MAEKKLLKGPVKRSRTTQGSKGLVTRTCERTGEEFTFFFGQQTVFSQWHPCTFTVDGVQYNCAEQYMMHQKACLFSDDDMAKRILEASVPKKQKALGRQVKIFDVAVWRSDSRRIVKEGNMAKFGQNSSLKEELLATGTRTLVEASPRDRTWGIGLGASNPKATDRRLWRGTNWLGQVLTQVREELKDTGTKVPTEVREEVKDTGTKVSTAVQDELKEGRKGGELAEVKERLQDIGIERID